MKVLISGFECQKDVTILGFFKQFTKVCEDLNIELYWATIENADIIKEQLDININILDFIRKASFIFATDSKKELNKKDLNYNFEKLKAKHNGYTEDDIQKIYNNYHNLIKMYDQEYDFDYFITWGTTILGNAMKTYANEVEKKIYNFELGYFRPNTMVIDEKGINYESSIPRNFDEIKQIRKKYKKSEVCEVFRDEELYDFINKKKEFLVRNNNRAILALLKGYYKIQDIIYLSKIKNNKVDFNFNLTEDVINERYIFVPFQIQIDSQLLKHSPEIKKMIKLMRVTEDAVKIYNRKNNKIKIVYKIHPRYREEDVYKDYEIEEINDFIKNSEISYLTSSYDTPTLIEKSQFIITINSTVGIEALIKKKKVITLGNTFYNFKGLVWNCIDLNNLSAVIEEVVKSNVDEEKINIFLDYLENIYSEKLYFPAPTQEDIKRIVNKIFKV